MFNATVERIGVAVDPVTRRVQVRCSIKNADLKLKPEMFARVSFLATGEVKGIRVHNTSLVTEGIYVYVFVETETGTFKKRQVKLALRGNDHSFVESGPGGKWLSAMHDRPLVFAQQTTLRPNPSACSDHQVQIFLG